MRRINSHSRRSAGHVRVLGGAAAVSVAACVLASPPDWVCVTHPVPPGPPGRGAQTMGYDARRHEIVMFGGTNNNDPAFGDTWVWDGTVWEERALTGPTPPARTNAGIAFDHAAGRVIMYGGGPGGGVFLSDMWSWDGEAWTEIIPATSPGRLTGHGIATDPDRARIIMWGGSSSGNGPIECDNADCAATWEWDGEDWSLVATVGSPPPRRQPGLAYMGGGRVLMFGGRESEESSFGDTWIYDGVAETWIQVFPPQSPPARGGHIMVHESNTGRVLIFGGNFNGPHMNDTWEFDGVTWRQLVTITTPAARSNFAAAYDSQRREAVFFGGSRSGIYDTSETCRLTPAIRCTADTNGDGVVNAVDVGEFLNAFFSSMGACP